MKTKYMIAIGALGSTLAIGLPCTADSNAPSVPPPNPPQQINPPSVTPAAPSSAVWDGSEYVGQVGGKYYYQGPNNTWLPLDTRRQQRFEQWEKNQAAGNPSGQSSQTRNSTSSQGAAKGQNASAQTSQSQNTGSQSQHLGQNNSSGQSGQTVNTRSAGPAKGQNAGGQTSPIQTTGSQGQEMGQGPTWSKPNGEAPGTRNTRYQGHDMGQTHPGAPPLSEKPATQH